jgi:hypothetical protein
LFLSDCSAKAFAAKEFSTQIWPPGAPTRTVRCCVREKRGDAVQLSQGADLPISAPRIIAAAIITSVIWASVMPVIWAPVVPASVVIPPVWIVAIMTPGISIIMGRLYRPLCV